MRFYKIFKKTIVIFLTLSVLSQSVFASGTDFWESLLGNSLTNVTPAGMVIGRDASGNMQDTTFYSGGVYFKFGPSFSYPEPLFNFSAPKASVGCGGLSIKGMFVSILGLDRLEMMLKNAGASLAWGIAVGLVYSLPGVAKAFEMINTWAKKIQQLLANACQSGMAIGKHLSDQMGLEDNFVSNTIRTAGETLTDYLDAGAKTKKLGGFLHENFHDNMVYKGFDKTTLPDGSQVAENYRQFVYSTLISRSYSTDVLMSILQKGSSAQSENTAKALIKKLFVEDIENIPNFEVRNFAIVQGGQIGKTGNVHTLPISFFTKTLGNSASYEEKSAVAQSIFSLTFLRNRGSDVVLTGSADLSVLLNAINLNIIQKGAKSGNNTKQEEIAEFIDGKAKPYKYTADSTIHGNAQTIGELLQYIHNGSGANATSAADILENTQAVVFGVVAMPAANADINANLKKGKTFVFFTYPISKTNDKIKFFTEENQTGSKERSEKLINALVTGLSDGKSINIDEAIDTHGINLFVPDIYNKIKIMQQSTSGQRTGLIDLLAKYNAHQATMGVLEGLLGANTKTGPATPSIFLSGESGNSIVKSDKSSLKLSKDFDATYNEAVKQNMPLSADTQAAIKTFVESESSFVKELSGLEQKFKEIDRANKERAVKAAPKNTISK